VMGYRTFSLNFVTKLLGLHIEELAKMATLDISTRLFLFFLECVQ
jgi:hypothetical protein